MLHQLSFVRVKSRIGKEVFLKLTAPTLSSFQQKRSEMIFKIVVQCLLINYAYSLSTHPILIVVSYDAFRYNFFDTKLVPNMERLKNVGTHSDYLVNVFPTKTFPNHHSIATGLYPEVHGVIGNTYYDPNQKKVLNIGYEMFHYREDIKPIWVCYICFQYELLCPS